DELVITKETTFGDCGFTNHSFIYQIDFIYSIKRANQLLEYLKANIKEGQLLELWKVWLSDDMNKLNIPFSRCSYGELSHTHLVQMYNWRH
ncbi:magnesium transporter, partial [Bacillus sp. AFS017336]